MLGLGLKLGLVLGLGLDLVCGALILYKYSIERNYLVTVRSFWKLLRLHGPGLLRASTVIKSCSLK